MLLFDGCSQGTSRDIKLKFDNKLQCRLAMWCSICWMSTAHKAMADLLQVGSGPLGLQADCALCIFQRQLGECEGIEAVQCMRL